jgi:hypothetical protein
MNRRRLRIRRGRPRLADAKRRRTTTAGRTAELVHGTDELRQRKRLAAAGREDLELNGASVLFAHEHLNRQQFDTLGMITEMLQRIARAWGGRDGNVTGLWMAITSAMISTGYAPPPVGEGGFGLADGARRRLQRMCRNLDGSRDLVIDLAEGRVPSLVLRVLERRLDHQDADRLSATGGARPRFRYAGTAKLHLVGCGRRLLEPEPAIGI